MFIAEDQEYVDKILPIADQLPDLATIVVIDDSAMFGYGQPSCTVSASCSQLLQRPASTGLRRKSPDLSPDDPAFIVYTSGTTGHPKGALVAHGHHLAATDTVVAHYPTLRDKPHRTVVFLPMCHVLGRDVAITLPLISQLVPHFGEDPEDFATTIVRGRAHGAVHGAALFAEIRLACAGRHAQFERHQARRFTTSPCASPAAMPSARWDGNGDRGADALYGAFGRWCSGRSSTSSASTSSNWWSAAAPRCRPRPLALWHIYGVNVVEMYGQTEEAGGIIAGQRGPFPRPGNVGTPVDGCEVRLGDDGEVLVRGPDLFEGYWRNDEATREVKGADGWLRTGDVGEWRDGGLRLIDRARDFIVTAGGKTISPSFIENALRASPYVAEAVVFGHGRKYLTAIVEIDFDMVADWARANDVAYTGFTSLTVHPRIEDLIKTEIARGNADLARVEQIKVFRILPKALDPEEEGEPVTPDAQGQTQAHVRALQGPGRRHVRRQRRAADRRRRRRRSDGVNSCNERKSTR